MKNWLLVGLKPLAERDVLKSSSHLCVVLLFPIKDEILTQANECQECFRLKEKHLSLWKLSNLNGKKESGKSIQMEVLDARLVQRKI